MCPLAVGPLRDTTAIKGLQLNLKKAMRHNPVLTYVVLGFVGNSTAHLTFYTLTDHYIYKA